jgi:hypothetical protein
MRPIWWHLSASLQSYSAAVWYCQGSFCAQIGSTGALLAPVHSMPATWRLHATASHLQAVGQSHCGCLNLHTHVRVCLCMLQAATALPWRLRIDRCPLLGQQCETVATFSLFGVLSSHLTHPLAIHTPNMIRLTPNHKTLTDSDVTNTQLHKQPTTEQLSGTAMHDSL